jgi:hypothetical protein
MRRMQMVGPDVKTRFARFQARWRDPMLTTLSVLLAIVLFVLAPLHAAGHRQEIRSCVAVDLHGGVVCRVG